jgi:hypothetical protein
VRHCVHNPCINFLNVITLNPSFVSPGAHCQDR